MTQPAEAPLPWQAVQWRKVGDWLAADRFPHALLLAGPAGTGKRLFAHALVDRLLERAHLAAADPLLPQPVPHANLRWLVPAEAGAQIRIEDVRSLIDFAWTTAAGRRKVALVMPAERMNAYAANALLKTLEEPPGRCALLLVSDRPRALGPTLVSRCQRLQFGLCDAPAARAWLAGRVAGGDADAALWLAGGAPLRALEIAQGGVLRDVLGALGMLAGAGRSGGLAAFLERARRADLPLLVSAWQRLLHDVACGRPPAVGGLRVPASATARVAFQDDLAWAARLLAGTSNPSPQALLESLLDSWLRALAR